MYLTLLNGTGYIFDVDDCMDLRTKHRIMGALVGTANSRGWSTSEAALPLALTNYETQLLIDEGIAVLVSKVVDLSKQPDSAKLMAYKEEFDRRLLAQADALKAEKLRETKRHVDKILNGKRNKLLQQGKTAEAAQLYTDRIYDTDSLKYRVFHDLWKRGKYVTAGDAFGADFLVYPGDPLLYHASHIVIVQSTPAIRPLELIAKVRLSVIVNKRCVFAHATTAGNQIAYQTVAWSNPSK
ncbi:GH16791 [Drosophila grimshawi]|uniref:tRNA-splicing endonuclease subunit Sen34 n=1 Tax=Drosophila grimshawi TaxID=7222 RepID=B4J3T7_DROGR|nr:GH16791 [Drosophila grimshawi]